MIKGVLFQESLCDEPFWMLVACCMVNLTRWQQAEPIFEQLRIDYPTVEELAVATMDDLERRLQPLGLYKRRSVSLSNLAKVWSEDGPVETAEEVKRLPGCGKYASDSWAIFVEKRRDVVPTDIELITWLENNT